MKGLDSTLSEWMVISALLLLLAVTTDSSCDPDLVTYGCKIEDRECLCGFHCDASFRFSSRSECAAALTGNRLTDSFHYKPGWKGNRSRDPCHKNPCKHGGLCTQKSEHPRYSCHCAGTGYHGSRCEHKCPSYKKMLQQGLTVDFPSDCIDI